MDPRVCRDDGKVSALGEFADLALERRLHRDDVIERFEHHDFLDQNTVSGSHHFAAQEAVRLDALHG